MGKASRAKKEKKKAPGISISREEALEITRGTIARAEKERSEIGARSNQDYSILSDDEIEIFLSKRFGFGNSFNHQLVRDICQLQLEKTKGVV